MLSLFTDFDARLLWASLSISNKLFLLFFCCVAIYTFSLSYFVMLRLRTFNKQRANVAAASSRSALGNLRKRLGNLRQLHLFTLYLLWLCIVLNIPSAFNILGLYKTTPIGAILSNLAFLFHYYAPIFLVFLLLHSMQWFVCARVDFFDRLESS